MTMYDLVRQQIMQKRLAQAVKVARQDSRTSLLEPLAEENQANTPTVPAVNSNKIQPGKVLKIQIPEAGMVIKIRSYTFCPISTHMVYNELFVLGCMELYGYIS